MLDTLSWLPSAPAGFSSEVRSLKKDIVASVCGEPWLALKRLAGYALDEVQLSQVARLLSLLPDKSDAPAPLKLGLVGDGTLSLLGPAISASAVRRDLRVIVEEGDYGSAVREALDQTSPLHAAELDFLLVSCDRRLLGLDKPVLSGAAAKVAVEAAYETIRTIVEGFRRSVRRAVIVETVVPPMEPLFGSLDCQVAGTPYAMVGALNARLADWAASNNVVLADTARLAASVGFERWDEPEKWHASKQRFSADLIPVYGDFIARTLGALAGKSAKCLVLDLDNTLWSGVIGDDGVEGIVLGQGSATGEAFLAIQRAALNLRERGVILAVCSKNEADAALRPFLDHPEMVLKQNHIAVFQANWIDKAANLKTIAETLNIGLDALVFLDDNPVERAQVRRELPMVSVPELPDDPSRYPRTLMAAGYFDAVAFADEDRMRADDYQANIERTSLQAQANNLSDFLRSLAMTCSINPFDGVGAARIAQLINKSNQFNLTTRRYTEAQVRAIQDDPDRHAIQVDLQDRFGNNGMISVIIADKGPDTWVIDTWLMSCRVLGRRVEEAVLAHLIESARADGASALVGQYIPTAKNKMVAGHYEKLGFEKSEATLDGGTTWRLDLDSYRRPDLEYEVVTNSRSVGDTPDARPLRSVDA